MANEDLIAKKRELLERKRRLLALTESQVVEQPQGPSFGEGVMNSIRGGMMFGFRDEFDAGKDAFVDTLLNPGTPAPLFQPNTVIDTFKENFRSRHLDERLSDALFRKDSPKTAFTSEIGGAIVPGVGVYKGVDALARSTPTLAKLAGVGAAEGAAFGAGTADPGERLQGAGEGALFGGVGAPLMAGGLNLTKAVLGPVAQRLGDSLFGSPRDRAIREINSALDADEITQDEAIELLRRMGPNAILPDLGDTLARQGRAVTSELGPRASSATRFLDARQLMSQRELRQMARRATGSNNFDKGIIEIVNGAESQAAPIYQEVFSQVLDVTPDMISLLQRPAMKSARRKAATILNNEGFSSDIINDVTDVRYMDAVKRALDDQIGAAVRSGNNNQARVLTGLKNEFINQIDSQVPRYAEARSLFAGEQAIKEAAEFGRGMLTGNRRLADIKEQINLMGQSELDAARMGFLDWLEGSLDNQSVRRNTIAQKFADVPKFRETVEALFPTPEAAMQFLDRAAAQAQFARTRNIISGGSQTARIQSDRNALQPGFLSTALDAASGQSMIASALQLIRGNTRLSPETLEEMGKILFNPRVSASDLRRPLITRMIDLPALSQSTIGGASAGIIGTQVDDFEFPQ